MKLRIKQVEHYTNNVSDAVMLAVFMPDSEVGTTVEVKNAHSSNEKIVMKAEDFGQGLSRALFPVRSGEKYFVIVEAYKYMTVVTMAEEPELVKVTLEYGLAGSNKEAKDG